MPEPRLNPERSRRTPCVEGHLPTVAGSSAARHVRKLRLALLAVAKCPVAWRRPHSSGRHVRLESGRFFLLRMKLYQS